MKARITFIRFAPKDGTALGVIVEMAVLEQVLGNEAVKYDAANFTYVGRVADVEQHLHAWHRTKVAVDRRCGPLKSFDVAGRAGRSPRRSADLQRA